MNEVILHNVIKRLGRDKIETAELLIECFKEEGYNKFKAPELAENFLYQFLEFVNTQINDHSKKEIVCLFQPTTNKYVTCFDFGFFEVQEIKRKLLTTITDRQFEFVGAHILKKCFNAIKANSTKGKSDGGYDFYGIINQKENGNSNSVLNIEVFGQAKQYSNNITRPEIDKFVGFIERNKNVYKYKPTIYIFVTTSDYSDGAYEFGTEYGIVCLNGLQISSMIYRQLLTNNRNFNDGFNDFIEDI